MASARAWSSVRASPPARRRRASSSTAAQHAADVSTSSTAVTSTPIGRRHSLGSSRDLRTCSTSASGSRRASARRACALICAAVRLRKDRQDDVLDRDDGVGPGVDELTGEDGRPPVVQLAGCHRAQRGSHDRGQARSDSDLGVGGGGREPEHGPDDARGELADVPERPVLLPERPVLVAHVLARGVLRHALTARRPRR